MRFATLGYHVRRLQRLKGRSVVRSCALRVIGDSATAGQQCRELAGPAREARGGGCWGGFLPRAASGYARLLGILACIIWRTLVDACAVAGGRRSGDSHVLVRGIPRRARVLENVKGWGQPAGICGLVGFTHPTAESGDQKNADLAQAYADWWVAPTLRGRPMAAFASDARDDALSP